MMSNLKKQSVVKDSVAGIESVGHWLEDRMQKRIYEFTEGSRNDQHLLGLKGSSLCELSKMGFKVPPGFIITTDTCQDYFKGSEAMSAHLVDALKSSITKLENKTGKSFSLSENSRVGTEPLLLSVRSGAAVDMPSMMPSVLNVGVNDFVVQRLTSITSNPKFALDVQRRFLQMFGTVVLNVPQEKYSKILADTKAREGVSKDYELSSQALQSIVNDFKLLGEVPNDPFEQLKMTVNAIFDSWLNPRAKKFRKLYHLSENLGTAVVVQSMVFGNINPESCVGKLFTRNPDTGVNEIYGEYSCCMQGDEVLSGFDETAKTIDDFQSSKPSLYSELKRIAGVLENFFGDAQEIEFTVENGDLYFLESIPARRSPQASVKIAIDLALNGQLTERQSIQRINAQQMDYFLNPTMSQETDVSKVVLGTGLATSIGSAAGKAIFRPSDAMEYRDQGVPTILICDDGSAEDATVVKMVSGLLLMHGGVTNSIVDLARTFDKTVITGAAKSGLAIDYNRECVYDDSGKICIEKGQMITLDGPTGSIVDGNVVTIPAGIQSDFRTLMRWSDQYRRTPLMVHAKSWNEVYRSLELHSNGVGLLEMESFFLEPDRLRVFQGYLFTDSEQARGDFMSKLEEFLTEDFRRVFGIMNNKRVSIRLFNSSVDSFFPTDVAAIESLSNFLSMDSSKLKEVMCEMATPNPLLGIRGVRCALLHQLFLAMQIRAIFGARHALEKTSKNVTLQILIPMLTSEHEAERVVALIQETANKFFSTIETRFQYDLGAIIETPRACLCADRIAKTPGLSSALFSCDQLTEFVLGISKCESAKLTHSYRQEGISKDPFKGLDRDGVGTLISKGIHLIRNTFQPFQIGVYGSQLRSRAALDYFKELGVDFLVCSLPQLPIVKVSSAQTEIAKTPHYELPEKYWPRELDASYWR